MKTTRPGVKAGDRFDTALFERLLDEEYSKARESGNRDVHDDSKDTTLPIAREIVMAYVTGEVKPPWYIGYLNINLNNHDLEIARLRIALYRESFHAGGAGITENLDFSE